MLVFTGNISTDSNNATAVSKFRIFVRTVERRRPIGFFAPEPEECLCMAHNPKLSLLSQCKVNYPPQIKSQFILSIEEGYSDN